MTTEDLDLAKTKAVARVLSAMTEMFSDSDISQQSIRSSYNWISMNSERVAKRVAKDYVHNLTYYAEKFSAWATEENETDLINEFPRFIENYRSKLMDYHTGHSRVFSTAITGGGGVTGRMLRRNDKGWASIRNKWEAFEQFQEKATRSIRKRYDSVYIENRPIMAGDDDAVERLEEKIAKQVAQQEKWKATNKIFKRYCKVKNPKTIPDDVSNDLVLELIEQGYSAREVHEFTSGDNWYGFGVAPYMLTNNNANIRTNKIRLKGVKQLKALDKQEMDWGHGLTVETFPEENRVRFYFPSKPSAEMRKVLKREGFKWSPSNDAWQRYLQTFSQYKQQSIREAWKLENGEVEAEAVPV